MRFLNESIARRANAEDGVTGRFWEGRYKSQALVDEGAVLACMTYVDLNPIRAGIADRLEASDYTSIQQRLSTARHEGTAESSPVLQPLMNPFGSNGDRIIECLSISPEEYVALARWVAAAAGTMGKASTRVPSSMASPLQRLGLRSEAWPASVLQFGRRFRLVAGAPKLLMSRAQQLGQFWIQGITAAGLMYR